MSGLFLREAKETDCELLWRWRNEENTRKWFGDSSPVPLVKHKEWFSKKLMSKDTIILIVMDKGYNDIGQVRFKLDDAKCAEISISIATKYRNKGYGSFAIKQACDFIFDKYDTKKVVSFIKEDNTASLTVFNKAGFIKNGTRVLAGFKAVEMSLEAGQGENENSN